MLLIFRPFRVGHKVQIGGNTGTVRELSLFWTELVVDDKVQVIVPNSGVWGQPLRNFSVYPGSSYAGDIRMRIAEDSDLEATTAKIRSVVEGHPQVLADPAPSVLFDRSGADDALEIVIGFSIAEDDTAAVKSDLIKGVHDELRREDAPPQRARRHA
jgi:small conductance mechanosensitive channel